MPKTMPSRPIFCAIAAASRLRSRTSQSWAKAMPTKAMCTSTKPITVRHRRVAAQQADDVAHLLRERRTAPGVATLATVVLQQQRRQAETTPIAPSEEAAAPAQARAERAGEREREAESGAECP